MHARSAAGISRTQSCIFIRGGGGVTSILVDKSSAASAAFKSSVHLDSRACSSAYKYWPAGWQLIIRLLSHMRDRTCNGTMAHVLVGGEQRMGALLTAEADCAHMP